MPLRWPTEGPPAVRVRVSLSPPQDLGGVGRKPSLLDTARKEWATVGAFLLGLLVLAASQFVPELPPG